MPQLLLSFWIYKNERALQISFSPGQEHGGWGILYSGGEWLQCRDGGKE